ncbi:MAG: glycosyltransferase family 4 protein [Chloroflexota bacterium]
MRVLMLAGTVPLPAHSGALVRKWETLRYLAARHQVTYCAFVGESFAPEAFTALRELGVRVVAVPWMPGPSDTSSQKPFAVQALERPEMTRHLRQLTAGSGFDVALVERIWMAVYAPAIDAPIVLHEHNAESDVMARYARAANGAHAGGWGTPDPAFQEAAVEAARLRALEDEWWPRVSSIVAVTERDRELISARARGTPVSVVPNGVNTAELRPVGTWGPRALFLGAFDYQPNLDAAAELCTGILPLLRGRIPDAQLTIAGRTVPPRLLLERWLSGIRVAVDVPRLESIAGDCAVMIVPIRVGGGSRIKILTALALGLPVVSTTVGAEGLDLSEADGVIVRDSPADIAEAAANLMLNRDTHERLARAGRAAVEQRFDWSHTLRDFDGILTRAVRGAQPRSRPSG